MSDLAHLLAPGRIGSLPLRNRILMCPMGDALAAADGTVSERQIAYYEARARGGAALVIMGSTAVAYPSGSFSEHQTAISSDDHVAGLAELARRVHAHGAAVAAQLVHGGPQSLLDIARGQPLLVPSKPGRAHPDRLSMMLTPEEQEAMLRPFSAPTAAVSVHEATDADLERVIEQFAQAARRARAAGFDGVELHAGHGYLLDAFRSPASNRREDAWGGDHEARCRLLMAVVDEVRARVGPDFPLWCRLNGDERHREHGETLSETLALAPRLEAAGLDALHVSAYADPYVAVGITDAHTPHVPGALVGLARAVKAVVDIPVITFGRLDPDAAEAVVAAGDADFVAMGRPLLADPDLPRKLVEGRPSEVRPCAYQYRCIGNIFLNGHVACVTNPETARELELGARDLRAPGSVLVVGAGPAGLEAARRLARGGRSVVVADAAAEPGGRLRLAAHADEALAPFLDWLVDAVARAGAELRLGRVVDASEIASGGWDEVVVATGAAWGAPDGLARAQVLDLDALWTAERSGGAAWGEEVVVLGGSKAGLSIAALAQRRGAHVTVLEPTGVLAPQLGPPGRFRLVHDLEQAGATLRTDAEVRSVVAGRVRWHERGEEHERAADLVVGATPHPRPSPLVGELARLGVRVRAAGDCVAPRGIEGAMLDAAELAASVR